MRKLHWALLLPLLLLFAQQGELRHEYRHYARSATSCEKAPETGDPCPLCLAYAHLTGTAKSEVVAPVLLTDLAFHFTALPSLVGVDRRSGAPRSRGPPALL